MDSRQTTCNSYKIAAVSYFNTLCWHLRMQYFVFNLLIKYSLKHKTFKATNFNEAHKTWKCVISGIYCYSKECKVTPRRLERKKKMAFALKKKDSK